MNKTLQTSAIERLRALPDIFRGGDLTVRFGWTSKQASHYLYLWKKRGLVVGLGGHSDVFANTLKNEHTNWEIATRMAMPGSVLVGIDVLRRAGWTTQIPNRPQIVPPSSGPKFSITPFEVVARNEDWLKDVRLEGIAHNSNGPPSLKPAWALADLIASEGWGTCGLQPDDIDTDALSDEDKSNWRQACELFGINDEEMNDALSGEGQARER